MSFDKCYAKSGKEITNIRAGSLRTNAKAQLLIVCRFVFPLILIKISPQYTVSKLCLRVVFRFVTI